MSTWALIVILFGTNAPMPRANASLAVVPGFNSQPSCYRAGLQVQKSSHRAVEFACVEVK